MRRARAVLVFVFDFARRRPRAIQILSHVAVAMAAFAYALVVLLGVPGRMAAGDSHYHFAVATSIWRGDLAPDPSRTFPWGLWRDLPVDHYWGFHVLIAPFAAIGDPETGMKVATAALFAVLVSVIGIVVARRGAFLPWAWAAASVLFVAGQDWRYLQLRGGVLLATLLLAFVEVGFFVDDPRRRRLGVLGLATLSSLAYNGAVVLLPFHVAGVAGLFALPDRGPARARLLDPLLTAAGLVVALVVNPYFDRTLSTFRFAFVNIAVIGRDTAGLFAAQENLEVSPFPIALLAEWSWTILLVATVAGLVVLARRVARQESVERAEVVYGALALAGIVLTARMLRIREYSVPIAFVFLAVMTRTLSARRWQATRLAVPAVALVLVAAAAIRAVPRTRATIERAHPPSDLYAGARPVLERVSGGAPVANLVLGDGNLLLWEWSEVKVAQGGSPYFSYLVDRPLHDDLRTLRDAPNDERALAALDRIGARGSRLVSARPGLAFHGFAARHPERVRPVWIHPRHRSALYLLEPVSERGSSSPSGPPP